MYHIPITRPIYSGGISLAKKIEVHNEIYEKVPYNIIAMKTIIEIRSAEGGEHSKLLIQDQFALYCKVAKLNSL